MKNEAKEKDTQRRGTSALTRLLGQINDDVKVKTVLPAGAFGANNCDTDIDLFLRWFSVKKGKEEDWPEKYGTNYESKKVIIHRFCWCDSDECPYCFRHQDREPTKGMIEKYGNELEHDGFKTAPNFWYKPFDFKVWWYKYIGRSVYCNKELMKDEFNAMIADLILDLP